MELKTFIEAQKEITPEFAEASKLHNEIMLNGQMCAESLVALCKNLKRMRDEKLYTELGYDSFDNYTENAVGIKARQAYNYINTYEKLGSTVLQSNATLGITKLQLLASMNPTERVEIIDNGEAESMSVAEMKKLVEENKNQGEQINLLKEELEEQKELNEDLEWQLDEARGKEKNSKVSDEEINKIKAELEAELKSEIAEEQEAKFKDMLVKAEQKAEKARKELEKQKLEIKNAKEIATANIKEELESAKEELAKEKSNSVKKLEMLQQQIVDANNLSEKLKKELALSDSASAEAKVYIQAVQNNFNALLKVIETMEAEQNKQFKSAVVKLCDSIKKLVE